MLSKMEARYEPDSASKGGSKARLLRIADLDGRTKVRKAAEKLLGDLLSDLGGSERVSTAQRVLAEQACVLQAMAEHQAASWLSGEDVDVNSYATTVNATRRVLCDLGLERRANGVEDLASYLQLRRAAETERGRGGFQLSIPTPATATLGHAPCRHPAGFDASATASAMFDAINPCRGIAASGRRK